MSIRVQVSSGERLLGEGAGPIEVRRWREGRHMLWEYVGFTATCELLAPSEADPASVVDG